MRNYNPAKHANVPTPRRSPDDLVELVQDDQPARSASMRRAIPGINCPDETNSWQDIAEFRANRGLPPVTR